MTTATSKASHRITETTEMSGENKKEMYFSQGRGTGENTAKYDESKFVVY